MQARLIKDSDNLIVVDGLYDKRSAGGYINDATVTATIATLAGDAVSGQSLPVTLSYVTGTNGRYEGVFDDALGLSVGFEYRVTVTATKDGLTRKWKQRAFCSE